MFVAALQLLSDALITVNRLSLAFQCASVDLTIIGPLLNSILTTLEKIKVVAPSVFEDKVRGLITKMNMEATELHKELRSGEGSDTDVSDDRETEPPIITITPTEPQRFQTQVCQKFLSQMIANLQERFPHAELLEAFSILDPEGLPGQQGIVEDQLDVIRKHYQDGGPMAISVVECFR